tara:strand:- start:238 stop:705 length:468 start_codon:yes stop_codon:yes gene_type:complete
MAHSIELSGNKIKQPADYLNTQECITLINNKCAKTTKEPWNRLGRTAHIEKLTTFVETILKDEYSLTESETKDGIEFLIKMNERKRFSRQKDITFNRETSSVVAIPILVFNETTRQFSLQSERKLNTVKNTTAAKKQGKPKVRPRSKTCDEGENK